MEEEIKNRGTKGITLVALVVTIIILLILSGVAINLSLGENGIFERAKEGAEIYQNASENEKIEIDKVSNYIDDLNEFQKMSEVEKAIKEGKVYKQNTIIYDKYNNSVKVPAGFKLAEDSGKTVLEGVVIEDVEAGDNNTKGNQYVWVPIGNIKYNTNGEYNTINFGRYIFAIDGTPELKQSADNYKEIVTIDQYYQELVNSNYGNIVAKNLEDFIAKVKSAGGYYIGRYEAGKVSGNTNTFTIKEGQEVYNSITQPKATTLARNLYSNNSNFESDLINSYVWSTTIVFIQKFSGDKDYSRQIGESVTGIWEKTGTNLLKSDNLLDKRCNIYDMASGVQEWSTETAINQDSPITYCGGISANNHTYTSYHYWNGLFPSGATSVGFRTILYL